MTGHLQDIRTFLASYRAAHPDDVLTVRDEISAEQDTTAVIWELASQGRHPLLVFDNVAGLDFAGLGVPVVTNIFGSRERIARMIGATVSTLHAAYQKCSHAAVAPREVASGPITEIVETKDIDLATLPMLKHFATDRCAYITNGAVIAEGPDARRDPATGRSVAQNEKSAGGNVSYHRAMIRSNNELATSLHSRGHLWRLLEMAKANGKPMAVAMVIGAHPLFMLAASARLGFLEDERNVAGGLMGQPLEVVRTPKYGIRVPAYAEFVLEGVIDPEQKSDEGPFGEFTGYSSNRSTNNVLRVETIMRRKAPILVDVAGGNSAEHLNLGRVPREAEMVEKLRDRFPSVTAVHYPSSGTHFHAYVAVKQMRPGEARQIMVGLLGWDPYLKTVIAVDEDVDVTRDDEVLWALATHFQPHRDIVVIDGLPGNALDPSASGIGTTSRMGLDATRGPGFEGVRATISDEAAARARTLLSRVVK